MLRCTSAWHGGPRMERRFEFNRRKFIAAAGAIAAGGVLAAGAGQAASAALAAEWFDRPMRWMQLVLVENDPGTYDPKWWLDLFQRVHADAACLSAGGSVAYYPTEIQHHYRSAWMKDGADPFGELVRGCREL